MRRIRYSLKIGFYDFGLHTIQLLKFCWSYDQAPVCERWLVFTFQSRTPSPCQPAQSFFFKDQGDPAPARSPCDMRFSRGYVYSSPFATNLSLLKLKPSGDEGTRTPGIRLAKAALSQLSYIPRVWREWAFQGSNLRPRPYQRRALTS